MSVGDTIFALSSGSPPAAIAIVRISGPAALAAAAALAGPLPAARRATLRRLRDASNATLDQALVLVFPASESATGEDVVELHCHGGRAVVAAVDGALAAMPGLRRAEGGEFTRRALLNGRIDLAQAEALGDLLIAETEDERRAAIAGVEGSVAKLVDRWSMRLTTLSAQVEALIDYDEEGDVATGATSFNEIVDAVAGLRDEMSAAVAAPSVERIRDGVRVVLAGPPNAGKSTLLNLMAGRDAAIVSPIAGTTRDRIEAPVRRGDTAYVLIDTAGLSEEALDPIEAIGIDRGRAAAAAADLVVWLGDDRPERGSELWVWARSDAAGRSEAPADAIAVSQDDPSSIIALWAAVAERTATGSRPSGLNRRHIAHIQRSRDRLVASSDLILLAEGLRSAAGELSGITAFDRVDAMLDALFAGFCVGK